MNAMLYLLPIALFLGAAALLAFLWSLRSGQFDDLEGDAARMLHEPAFPESKKRENDDAR